MSQDFDQMSDEQLLALYQQERDRLAGRPTPKLASGQQTQESEDIRGIQTLAGINNQLDQVRGRVASGALKLGPIENTKSTVLNFLGRSTPNSRNYASLQATIEKLRNDALKEQKGTQTEGDAQRALNEFVKSLNDPDIVQQRANEIQNINRRAIDNRKALIQQRRAAQGVPAADLGAVDIGSINNPFDLTRGQSRSTIPLGSYYKDPFGNVRRNDNGDAGNPKIDILTGLQQKEPMAGRVSKALAQKVLV